MTDADLPTEAAGETPAPDAATPPPPEATGPTLPAADAELAPEEKRRRRKLIALLLLSGALLLLLVIAIWYLLFRQPVPLPGITPTDIPHYNTAFAGLDRPMGIAVSPSGDRMYVSQTENSRTAVILDGSGAKIGELLPPVSTGASHSPVYVARDPIAGEIYVTDRLAATIYIYDAQGNYLREYQPTVARPGWQPLGITFDKAGNLYVTDLGAAPQQVVEFDRTGAVVRTLGAAEGLNFPNGVAVDGNGTVYVSDSNNGRVLVYDTAGTMVAQIGRGASEGSLGLPRGIVVDTNNHLFVVDSSAQQVFVFHQLQAGQSRLDYLGGFGAQGAGDGQFMYPNGAAIDGAGRLFVTDSANGRVQLWNY